MIAGKTQYIPQSQSPRTQKVRLDSDTVPVTANDLHNWLKTVLKKNTRSGNARHPYNRSLVVGHIVSVGDTAKHQGFLLQLYLFVYRQRLPEGDYEFFG